MRSPRQRRRRRALSQGAPFRRAAPPRRRMRWFDRAPAVGAVRALRGGRACRRPHPSRPRPPTTYAMDMSRPGPMNLRKRAMLNRHSKAPSSGSSAELAFGGPMVEGAAARPAGGSGCGAAMACGRRGGCLVGVGSLMGVCAAGLHHRCACAGDGRIGAAAQPSGSGSASPGLGGLGCRYCSSSTFLTGGVPRRAAQGAAAAAVVCARARGTRPRPWRPRRARCRRRCTLPQQSHTSDRHTE
jgi:hypothetical protein